MKLRIAAVLALTAASSLQAQIPAPPASADFSTATPIAGNWVYSATGSTEATFLNGSSQPQLTIHCNAAARRVTISKPATGAAPLLSIWTSTQTRNIPASYNPATARLSADLSAYDPLLDAMAFSRGRLAAGVPGQPMLVLPAWVEVARVIEDCRA
jgi:hypothetical protein